MNVAEWPWERLAMTGQEMPNGLPQEEQLAFLCMRSLHDQYRRGIISKDRASAEKAKLLTEFRKSRDAREFAERLCQRWTKILHAADNGASEFRLNPSLEAAEKMLKAIEGSV